MPSSTKQGATEGTEWIVAAKLPTREVEFARNSTSRAIPTGVRSLGPDNREATLGQLFDYLASVLEVRPVLLKTSGAVSITASAEELERISGHPLVKRIDPNRRLSLRRA